MTDLAAVHAGVKQLHARYTDAVWRKDAAAFADCFAEDGEWRISGMTLRGRERIAGTIDRIFVQLHRVLFSYGDPVLDEVDGQWCARVMVNERVAWADGRTNISIGRYYERLVEEAGVWRFGWRLFELHYRGPPDLTGEWYEHPDHGPPPGMPPLEALALDTSSAKWKLGTTTA